MIGERGNTRKWFNILFLLVLLGISILACEREKPEQAPQTGHSKSVNAVAVSPDGHLIVSGSSDNTIKLWEMKTAQVLRTLSGHSKGVNSVAISPDGQCIISGSSDQTLKLWAVKTGKLLQTFDKQ